MDMLKLKIKIIFNFIYNYMAKLLRLKTISKKPYYNIFKEAKFFFCILETNFIENTCE